MVIVWEKTAKFVEFEKTGYWLVGWLVFFRKGLIEHRITWNSLCSEE